VEEGRDGGGGGMRGGEDADVGKLGRRGAVRGVGGGRKIGLLVTVQMGERCFSMRGSLLLPGGAFWEVSLPVVGKGPTCRLKGIAVRPRFSLGGLCGGFESYDKAMSQAPCTGE